jgi:hypothetical protein
MIFSFCNNIKRQSSLLKLKVVPKYRRYAQFLSIIATLILIGCATDSREAVLRREILQQWTEITGAQTGGPLQGLPTQMNSPLGKVRCLLKCG